MPSGLPHLSVSPLLSLRDYELSFQGNELRISLCVLPAAQFLHGPFSLMQGLCIFKAPFMTSID